MTNLAPNIPYLSEDVLAGLNLTTQDVIDSIETLIRGGAQGTVWNAPKAVILPPDGRYMVYLVIWIVVGGNATFWGPIAGVTVMSFIFELSRPLAEWRPLLFGVILIIFLTVLPGGLEMIYETTKEKIFGKQRKAG